MAQSTEEVRRDIESTRQELSRDVGALSEKVSPGRIVQRRVEGTKGRLSSLKDKVMGGGSSGTSASSGSIGGTDYSLSEKVSDMPEMMRRQTDGNPLAAGLVAFAGGWLISSLLPATRAEEHAAQAVQEKSSELAEPVKQQLTEAAGEMKDNLQDSAQQSVQSVKETATNAAATVKEEGTVAASSVKDQASDSVQQVNETRQS
jgi:hypothetical protein